MLQLFLSCFHLAALKFALHQEFETFNKRLGAISSNYAWFDSDAPPPEGHLYQVLAPPPPSSLRDISSCMSGSSDTKGTEFSALRC